MKSQQSDDYFYSVRRRSQIAAAPIAGCMILPLVQVGGILYLYDLLTIIAITYLGIPSRRLGRSSAVIYPLGLLGVAVLIATASTVLRWGIHVKPLQYTTQYSLALLYFLCLYQNLSNRRISLRLLSKYVTSASIVLALLAIILFVVTLRNRSFGNALYSGYLQFAGFSDKFFLGKVQSSIDATGVVRATGTWDVPTTFGGMMALSMAWIHIARPKFSILFTATFLGTLAILASNSRHAWITGAIIILTVLPLSATRRVVVILLMIVGFVIVVSFVDNRSLQDESTLGLLGQVNARIERTFDQGIQDSSIQLRYVDGTARFLRFFESDPSAILFGVGIGAEKALEEIEGSSLSYQRMKQDNMFGFVSNGWLLIWRNLGILGFIGLIGLFVGIRKLGGKAMTPALLVCGLIIFSDNYSIQATRCFFLIMCFLAANAARASTTWKHVKLS